MMFDPHLAQAPHSSLPQATQAIINTTPSPIVDTDVEGGPKKKVNASKTVCLDAEMKGGREQQSIKLASIEV